jgi:hypothetical protein
MLHEDALCLYTFPDDVPDDVPEASSKVAVDDERYNRLRSVRSRLRQHVHSKDIFLAHRVRDDRRCPRRRSDRRRDAGSGWPSRYNAEFGWKRRRRRAECNLAAARERCSGPDAATSPNNFPGAARRHRAEPHDESDACSSRERRHLYDAC